MIAFRSKSCGLRQPACRNFRQLSALDESGRGGIERENDTSLLGNSLSLTTLLPVMSVAAGRALQVNRTRSSRFVRAKLCGRIVSRSTLFSNRAPHANSDSKTHDISPNSIQESAVPTRG